MVPERCTTTLSHTQSSGKLKLEVPEWLNMNSSMALVKLRALACSDCSDSEAGALASSGCRLLLAIQ